MTITTATTLLLFTPLLQGAGTLEAPTPDGAAQQARWTAPDGIVLDDAGAAAEQRTMRGKRNQIVETLWVETEFDSDGDGRLDRMHVDVTRPRATETDGLKVAAVYETSPYFWGFAGGGMEYFWDARQELGADPPERTPAPEVERQSMRDRASSSLVRTFVPRGFAVVHSASPGTGYSQGCPTVGGSNEALAPKAVVDWLNGRAKGYTAAVGGEPVVADWCTGKVGMMGTSYNGTLPIAAASTGVEGLETIVPVAPNTSYYHYYRSNGLVRHPGGYMGEDIDVLYDFINSGDPERRGWCNENVRDAVLVANLDRKTGDMSEWWAARDYSKQLGNVKASVLMAHGFNDWNVMPGHSFRVREVVKSMGLPTICYYHQGGHGGDPPKELLVRWMTRFLYGVENG
ncbi:MAG: CocE/NonD family hydrolase, partial [Planctomycetota bacterium]